VSCLTGLDRNTPVAAATGVFLSRPVRQLT